MMIHSDEITTALVVARPTPCVPPVVRIPKEQPTSAITIPKMNGFSNPCDTSTHFSACQAEVQYSEYVMPNCAFAIRYPPISPMKSAMTTNNGSVKAVASNRGVTS